MRNLRRKLWRFGIWRYLRIRVWPHVRRLWFGFGLRPGNQIGTGWLGHRNRNTRSGAGCAGIIHGGYCSFGVSVTGRGCFAVLRVRVE